MADDPGAMAGAAGYVFSGFGHCLHGLTPYRVAGLNWDAWGAFLVGTGETFGAMARQQWILGSQ